MEQYFEKIKKEQLTHAYLLLGDDASIKEKLFEYFKKQKIVIEGNPDVALESYTTLTIDDARELKNRAAMSGVEGTRYFILSVGNFVREAEHALLKLFEEATHAHFFIIMPAHAPLLDTFLSRFVVLRDDAGNKYESEVKKFLQNPPEVRMKFVTEFLKTHKDEDDPPAGGGKVRLETHAFVVALMKTARKQAAENAAAFYAASGDLQYIADCEVYLRDRGAAPKMILESIALTIKQ